MNWTDEITLIKFAEQTQDADGYTIQGEEIKTTIFANEISIGTAEFYNSEKSGHKLEAKVEVYTEEYQGETVAEYGGKRLSILRTYSAKPDITELTLTSIKNEVS